MKGHSKGFTLLEVLLALALAGIVGAGASVATVQILKGQRYGLLGATYTRQIIKSVQEGVSEAATQRRYAPQYSSLFDFAVISLDGNVTLGGNSEVLSDPREPIQGNVYAKGSIALNGNAKILGDVAATGTITKTGNASIVGEERPNLEQPLSFAGVNIANYITEAVEGGSIKEANFNGNGTVFLGPVCIKGDLVASGNKIIQLQGPVYVEGKIIMSGNSRVDGPGVLIAAGTIEITGNHKLIPNRIPLVVSTNDAITLSGNGFASAILYAPLGNIALTGNSKVYGSVIGKSVSGSGNNVVEYPVLLSAR